MEMSAPISVILSSDDTLCSKRREVIVNGPWIKRAALGVSDKEVASIANESRHVTEGVLAKLMLSARTQGTPCVLIVGLWPPYLGSNVADTAPTNPPCNAPARPVSTKCTADDGRTRYGQEGEPGVPRDATSGKREPIGHADPFDGPATPGPG